MRELERLTGEGYDVVIGLRKSGPQREYYIALETSDRDPKEFYGATIPDVIEQAAKWAGVA